MHLSRVVASLRDELDEVCCVYCMCTHTHTQHTHTHTHTQHSLDLDKVKAVGGNRNHANPQTLHPKLNPEPQPHTTRVMREGVLFFGAMREGVFFFVESTMLSYCPKN